LIPFGIVYLTFAIAIAVILSVGISDLQKEATPESNTASVVAIMSTVYLVLLAIGCLFFSFAGLILLYVQFLLMIPGVIGLIFGLMKIKSEIDR
jgi:cytochrome c biogenesis protein CcdA